MKTIDELILGATFYGVGAFLGSEQDVMLVEPGASAGYEFIENYYSDSLWQLDSTELENELVKNFYDSLVETGLLLNGKIHLPGVGPILFQLIKGSAKESLFYTEVVSVEKCSDGYLVKLHNRSGFSTIKTKRILDTTTKFRSKAGIDIKFNKREIRALLVAKDSGKKVKEIITSEYQLSPLRFATDAVLSLPLGAHETVVDARKKINQFWLKQQDQLANQFDLLSIGASLLEVPEKQKSQSDWRWEPSIVLENGLAAFSKGVQQKSLIAQA